MSFILDALKKSENERQQVAPAEFASVPSSPAESRTPVWLWLLGALLFINVVVLAGFMLRSPAQSPAAEALPPSPQPVASAAVEPEPVAGRPGQTPPEPTASFADRVAQARTERAPVPAVEAGPRAGESGPEPAPGETDAPRAAVATVPVEPSPESAPADTFLPSIDELRMQGALSLPDLHVDIHVYSDVPADRFVFINMNKYRESDRLSEGPMVREITRDGVVLEHRGNAFVLPRE